MASAEKSSATENMSTSDDNDKTLIMPKNGKSSPNNSGKTSLQGSQDTAQKLGINNNLVLTTLEEVMDNIDLCKGKNIKSLFNMVYYLTFRLCLEKVNVKGLDLVQGDGADTLLGSLQVFMYRDTPQYMKKYNVDKDTARTMIKQEFYAKAIKK